MQKLVFTNGGGQTIDLTSGNFGITNWEGLSGVGLNIQTQQVPFQDGGVFLDALMEQREISVTVAIQDNNDLSARYELKRQLISALNPKLGEGVLVYTNDYLARQIKAVPQLPIFENKNSNDAGTLKASVVFSCPSPYWEDLEETVVKIEQGNVPEIINNGDVELPIKAEFVSSGVVNPALIDTQTGEKIEYLGTLNTDMVVNTNNGEKECYENNIKFITQVSGNSTSAKIDYNPKQGAFAVTNGNIITISYDCKNWEDIKTAPCNITDIKWDNYRNFWIIIGSITTHQGSSSTSRYVIYKTLDFITYEEIETGLTLPQITTLSVKQERVIVAYNGGVIVSNAELTTWQQFAISNTNFISIIYAESLSEYVALVNITNTSKRKIMTSTDGQTWSVTGNLDSSDGYNSIAYSETKNIFVILARGTQKWAYSTDSLATWSFKTLSYTQFTGLCYNEYNEQFVAVSSSLYQQGLRVVTSENGSTLKYLVTQPIEREDGVPMGSGNTTFYSAIFNVYINVGKQIITSNNLTEWNCRTNSIIDTTRGTDVIFDSTQDRFIIINFPNIWVTKDKKHFQLIGTLPTSISKLIIYHSQYFAIGNGVIMKSSNLIDWERNYDFNYLLTAINYGSINDTEYLVIVGKMQSSPHNFVVLTSSDYGNTWVETNTGITGSDINDVVIANNTIVGVGTTSGFISPLVIYSTNITTWTSISNFVETGSLKSIIYRDKHFTTVSSYGKVYISKFGDVWDKVADVINAKQIVFSKIYQSYYIVGYGVIRSTDLITWQNIDYNDNITAITNIAVSDKNTDIIVTSNSKIGCLEKQKGANLINKLSTDSNMNYKLKIGKNILRVAESDGYFSVILTFRQKYIGV